MLSAAIHLYTIPFTRYRFTVPSLLSWSRRLLLQIARMAMVSSGSGRRVGVAGLVTRVLEKTSKAGFQAHSIGETGGLGHRIVRLRATPLRQ